MGVARIFQRGGSHWLIQRVLIRLSPEYCKLFAYKKAYKGGVTGTPGPPWLCLCKLYYSSKILPCFWLVKTACIIHHNQRLLPKFRKNHCHIELMTSKVEPTTEYWTKEVKVALKVQPAAFIKPFTEKPGDEVVLFLEGKELIFFFKSLKIFWMNNKAIIEFSFCRIWRILQIWEGVIYLGLQPWWITPSLIWSWSLI